ncbi:MAG: helix-turn-helix domain-containing protein [Desulfomonilia bacterium]
MRLEKPQFREIISRDMYRSSGQLPDLKQVRDHYLFEVEHGYLRELMHETRGDIPRACRISGISRSRLYALLKKHGLSRIS